MGLKDILVNAFQGDPLAKIDSQIQAANDRLAEHKAERVTLSLEAALDGPNAQRRLKVANENIQVIEQQIADLQTARAEVVRQNEQKRAEQAVQKEQQRLTNLRDMVAQRDKIVAAVEEHITGLAKTLERLEELDRSLAAIAGGAPVGYSVNEVARVLGYNAKLSRLRQFAGPRLDRWLGIQFNAFNPQYRDKSLREIEQRAVADCLWDQLAGEPGTRADAR